MRQHHCMSSFVPMQFNTVVLYTQLGASHMAVASILTGLCWLIVAYDQLYTCHVNVLL